MASAEGMRSATPMTMTPERTSATSGVGLGAAGSKEVLEKALTTTGDEQQALFIKPQPDERPVRRRGSSMANQNLVTMV